MRERGSSGLVTGLTIAGIALLAVSLLALPDAIYWLPDALTEGGYYWTWLLEESMPVLMMLTAPAALIGAVIAAFRDHERSIFVWISIIAASLFLLLMFFELTFPPD